MEPDSHLASVDIDRLMLPGSSERGWVARQVILLIDRYSFRRMEVLAGTPRRRCGRLGRRVAAAAGARICLLMAAIGVGWVAIEAGLRWDVLAGFQVHWAVSIRLAMFLIFVHGQQATPAASTIAVASAPP